MSARYEHVAVNTARGLRITLGEVYGSWAVTPDDYATNKPMRPWVVTHRPTGFRAIKPVRRKDLARKIARRLAAECDGDEWHTPHAQGIPEESRKHAASIISTLGAVPTNGGKP